MFRDKIPGVVSVLQGSFVEVTMTLQELMAAVTAAGVWWWRRCVVAVQSLVHGGVLWGLFGYALGLRAAQHQSFNESCTVCRASRVCVRVQWRLSCRRLLRLVTLPTPTPRSFWWRIVSYCGT
jgi:hypothetical protein